MTKQLELEKKKSEKNKENLSKTDEELKELKKVGASRNSIISDIVVVAAVVAILLLSSSLLCCCLQFLSLCMTSILL